VGHFLIRTRKRKEKKRLTGKLKYDNMKKKGNTPGSMCPYHKGHNGMQIHGGVKLGAEFPDSAWGLGKGGTFKRKGKNCDLLKVEECL